ncbi:MAG: cephalosporin hydroxylase family protein [Pirellulaceae bacterium]
MNPIEQFRIECVQEIEAQGNDQALQAATTQWLQRQGTHKYIYHFSWLGRPMLQLPQDTIALQEIVWSVKPDLIIETGIAHGGSLIMSASLLTLLDYCEAAVAGEALDPKKPRRRVLGVDIDIRAHNRAAIEQHPMADRIEMIQGSSVDPEIIEKVRLFAREYSRVLVCLDSHHTHAHVLAELRAYARLVSEGSYCVVFDTAIEDMPLGFYPDRPWGKGNSPKTAVWEFLRTSQEFEIDRTIPNKCLITAAHDGYLKRVKRG